MDEKEILAKEQAPWTSYLKIKKNRERRLKLFTPLKIRKAYKEHLKYIKERSDKDMPIPK